MRKTIFGAAAVAILVAGQAVAQPPAATEPGLVTVLQTPPGSALVLRAGEVYELKLGDTVFEGDTIFTRTNGSVRFTIGGCDVGLGGQESIVVSLPSVCTTKPTFLEYDTVLAGVTVGTGAEIAATPTLLLALLVGGGAAAAAGAGDDSSPASP